jgi:hypothetical protein
MSLAVSAFGPGPSTGGITVDIFDGARMPFSDGQILITIRDGNQNQVSRGYHELASVTFEGLTVFQNFGDNYSVIASAGGYKDSGFYPVKIAAGQTRTVDLMLLPGSSAFNFANAKWAPLCARRPKLKILFSAGAPDDTAAANRYSDLMDYSGGAVLACMLNLVAAMDQALLPQDTALDYVKEVAWDRAGSYAMAQDRFFAWADPELVKQIELAKQHGAFSDAPFLLHPGATKSYKQIQFGEANLQFTFHENDRKVINGQTCILIEPDIDYYKDAGAHLLLEVLVNQFGSLTDPRVVYCLRWIAGRQAGIPEFDPVYSIERA